MEMLTKAAFSQFNNLSQYLTPDIRRRLSFCIVDVEDEWNSAFNFSSDLSFLSSCLRKTRGDLMQRLCTAAEVKFYFSSFFHGGSMSNTYLEPNKNCNLDDWVSGCEPGWACSAGRGNKIDLKNSENIPNRTVECQQCCEGFFCPSGLTCMIPCPLGSYCPLAKLNQDTSVCEPYRYQLPPGQKNHTCGGADIWADIVSGSELFCSAGSYCPNTVKKLPCSSGHFCRTGSVSPAGCYKLVNCKEGTESQNITLYGILLFAGLTLLLLIFYNCSDQVIAEREKKQAKSREAAAKSAKETVQAQHRWKSAKDIARKHAAGLQTSLSRTFSRKRSVKQHDSFKGLGQAKPGIDATLPPGGRDTGQSNLSKMMHDLEANPESQEGFNVEIGDKNLKKHTPKGKQLHTRSQIFKYAYGQIEKEKALQEQNKNLTFSGVISMASDVEIRKRPTIEVGFKDLTLTLKGKRKHLLRCVTGKIMPGRISAVMGPSGAGKTTFLSAVAGKATGCSVSGKVIINGKIESIQSYKKIIGFVPQDDIVHGNLTVEENLWFSARCRLSADLGKPEKVLVVERVIESLGLQSVRDSLVGTVEKRGISGGQRKRVNVGLEMVMEPSLLILDEPTSGLDSTSSLLLLRALRREALEGVNICMVVHQPSYTLFNMFDDLILLAKGGQTVYHGPVKKLEEYFSGLGIQVPDRVNPPDYLIDVLEGIAKLNTSSGVDYKELPLRWMLHNGYQVPADMLNSAVESPAVAENLGHASGTGSSGTDDKVTDNQSLAEDLWQDVKFNAGVKMERFQNRFFTAKDLSDRRTPGILKQYKYFLERVGKQRLREARITAVDYVILLLAGICLGTIAKVNDETFGALGYTYTVIAVSLLSGIAALRTFNLDLLHYWRESASGMSSSAYFLAKDTVDHFNTLIKPLVYLSMFYFFNNPRSSFFDNYFVLVCLVYCVTGLAYIFAICLQPGSAQLWSVLLPVVLTLVANQNYEEGILKFLMNSCYPKWALESFVVANAQRYSGVWLITRCGSLMTKSYKLKHWLPNLLYLVLAGLGSRLFALCCLVVFQKK